MIKTTLNYNSFQSSNPTELKKGDTLLICNGVSPAIKSSTVQKSVYNNFSIANIANLRIAKQAHSSFNIKATNATTLTLSHIEINTCYTSQFYWVGRFRIFTEIFFK